MKIAVCAGHHEAAQGAVNAKHKISEHEAATPIVEFLAKELKNFGHEAAIFHGRLKEKVRAINEGHFDLAIDLHFNASPNKKAKGCMVMYYPTSTTRKQQADKMSKTIADGLGQDDLGGRPAWYWGGSNPGTKPDYFTDKTNCPAFIPEPGFIDQDDFVEQYLLDENGYKRIAKVVAAALNDFKI